MKGNWVTTFAAGGVILLLTLFIGLQYNWLVKAGEATRDRMQRRVEADTRNFAEGLNREVHAAYFNFQTDPSAWERSDWAEFNARYDHWKNNTQYPELIREFVYFSKAGPRPLRYDPTARTFTAAEVAANVLALRQRFEDPAAFQSFYPDEFALVMPVHPPRQEIDRIILRRAPAEEMPVPEMPATIGYLVIMLDREVFAGRVLPDLARRHFPDGDFRLKVSTREGEPIYSTADISGEPDAVAGLFNLMPDRMFFVNGPDHFKAVRGDGIVLRERVESQTFSRTHVTPEGIKEGRFTIQVKPGTGDAAADGTNVKTSVIAARGDGADQWTLSVQHAAGSLDAYARNQFRTYFAAGLAIYLLMVGAIIAIVTSAMRSKRFAQRQMDFVSSVSHEFRTPLAVIYSAGENLADGVAADREQVTRYGSLIRSEGRKLSAMVEQILQFAGARSAKRRYNFSAVRPDEIVETALRECRHILDEKGFTVETDVEPGLPMLNADPEAVSTALQNLIHNSVKYSNGSRWIRVAASNGGGAVKLAVADNGIGVSAAELKHIFEPFYRARVVVDAQIHGNGLGLALVKEIAKAHGGSVKAKSEPGKGSEFTIELPARSEPPV
jgi:signal transduction histidine kinase